MLVLIFNILIFILSLVQNAQNITFPKGWVDPHDLSPSRDYLKYLNDKDDVENYEKKLEKEPRDCVCPESKDNIIAEAYFKRTINMILNSVNEESINDNKYSGYVFFKIDLEKYELLKKFANSVNGHTKKLYTKVDDALMEVLTKSTHQELREFLETWAEKGFSFLMSKVGVGCVIIFTYSFTIYKLFFANFHFRYILKFILINFIIINFIFTWIQLYQNAEIDKMAEKKKYDNVPVHCDPSKMNSFQFLWSTFSSEDPCKEYHHTMHKDIFWTITPGIVLAEMFSQTIKSPVIAIATAVADICSTLFYAFPWPLNIIIFPIILIFFIFLTCVVLSFAFSVPIKFNLFHLISTSFGHDRDTRTGDTISGKNLERLLNIASGNKNIRHLIENVLTVGEDEAKSEDKKTIHTESKHAIEDVKATKKPDEISGTSNARNAVRSKSDSDSEITDASCNVKENKDASEKASPNDASSEGEFIDKHIEITDMELRKSKKVRRKRKHRCECGSGDAV